MNPADYVYGVLDIFQIKIPRMTDANDVLQLLLTELDHYMRKRRTNKLVFGEPSTKSVSVLVKSIY